MQTRASRDLLFSGDPEDVAEIQFRVSPAIAVIILGLLALPLSHTAPREGRGGRIILGMLGYVIYANVLYLSQGLDRQWDIAAGTGIMVGSSAGAHDCAGVAESPGTNGREGSQVIKLVDRYVGRAAMQGTLLIWVGLTLLYMMISVLGEIRDAAAGYGFADALWFVLWTTPRMAYEIFPIAALLGVLVGVGSLAAGNELVAFRTSGVSRPAAGIGGAGRCPDPCRARGPDGVSGLPRNPNTRPALSDSVNAPARAIVGGPRGMWMRDGRDIVNIQVPVLSGDRGDQVVEFKEVVIYGFSETSTLNSITHARSAHHDGDTWRLDRVWSVTFEGDTAVEERTSSKSWPTEVRPELLDSAVTPAAETLDAVPVGLPWIPE